MSCKASCVINLSVLALGDLGAGHGDSLLHGTIIIGNKQTWTVEQLHAKLFGSRWVRKVPKYPRLGSVLLRCAAHLGSNQRDCFSLGGASPCRPHNICHREPWIQSFKLHARVPGFFFVSAIVKLSPPKGDPDMAWRSGKMYKRACRWPACLAE